ncbi:MAG: hypothetical protein ACJA0H_000461 [Francisellaceae bacterium]|jgi:hypothetical protein
MMNIKLIVTFVAVTFTPFLFAQDNEQKISCDYPDNFLYGFSTKHKELQNLALEVGPKLCSNLLLITDEEVESFESTLFQYAEMAKRAVQDVYPEDIFPGVRKITETWEIQLKKYKHNFDYINPISIDPETKGMDQGKDRFKMRFKLQRDFEANLLFTIHDEHNNRCRQTSFGLDCYNAAENLKSAMKPAFSLVNNAILNNNDKRLSGLKSDWEEFIKVARYQSPLDVWFTTTLQKNKFSGIDLVGPPNWQAFLLRPSIVYENIHELEKGNRDDVSIAIEWIGFNWWKEGIGFSLTSIYHDRPETDALGYGITLHIKNKYSFGYVHRSDNNGSIFFNIDLLEFFGENKAVYKKYKEYL